MSIGSNKKGSYAYSAGICFCASLVMFWNLGKDMAEAGQFRFSIGLALAVICLVIAVIVRDKWTAEKAIQDEQQIFQRKLDEIEIDLSLVKIERDELSSQKQLLLADLNVADVREELPSLDTSVHQIPGIDRSHVSKSLAILNQTSIKFWANADRSDRTTHPSKIDVVAWLVERGLSQKLADSGATIIRPEWAPTGRKSEE